MITLRIFYPAARSDVATLAYDDLQCSSWSVLHGQLLAVVTADGVRYYPLAGIESFIELPTEVI